MSETPKSRCIVYVDGFNFYYGISRKNPAWKWLNIQSFFELLRRNDDVAAIKYFTAEINPDKTKYLEPGVAMIRRRFPKIKVSVYLPQLPASQGRNNYFYQSIGVTCNLLPLGRIPENQLSQCVFLPNGGVAERPTEWC